MAVKDFAPPDAIRLAWKRPFDEQQRFFRNKLNLPTQIWTDIQRAAHDRAFVVAGAMMADLLQDLRSAVDAAISQGETLNSFRARFDDIVLRRGWSGFTGDGTRAGRDWRTRVIYSTNLSTSYAAGRAAQLSDPDLIRRRPYLRYVHNDSVLSPRPQHKAWGDARLTLPREHPFWKTHTPPNGFGCECRIVAAAAPAEGAATAPPAGWDVIDPRTGTPAGVDEGWGYAPGASANRPLLDLIDAKLLTGLDAMLGTQLWAELGPLLQREREAAVAEFVDAAQAGRPTREASVVVHTLEAGALAAVTRGASVQSSALLLDYAVAAQALASGAPVARWRGLPTLLQSARVYFDTASNELVYVFNAPDGSGPLALRASLAEASQRAASVVAVAPVDEQTLTAPRYVRVRANVQANT